MTCLRVKILETIIKLRYLPGQAERMSRDEDGGAMWEYLLPGRALSLPSRGKPSSAAFTLNLIPWPRAVFTRPSLAMESACRGRSLESRLWPAVTTVLQNIYWGPNMSVTGPALTKPSLAVRVDWEAAHSTSLSVEMSALTGRQAAVINQAFRTYLGHQHSENFASFDQYVLWLTIGILILRSTSVKRGLWSRKAFTGEILYSMFNKSKTKNGFLS